MTKANDAVDGRVTRHQQAGRLRALLLLLLPALLLLL